MDANNLHNRLNIMQVVDAFGEMAESIYKTKDKEITNELFPFYEHADHIQGLGLNSENNTLALMFLTASLTNRQKMLIKSKDHMRKVIGMYRKRSRSEGLMCIPLEEVKVIPILDVCEFKKIKRTGLRVMVSCPFHPDDTPSMLIDTKNKFKCFSCGKSGTVIDFIMELYGFTFITAVKHLQGHLVERINEVK